MKCSEDAECIRRKTETLNGNDRQKSVCLASKNEYNCITNICSEQMCGTFVVLYWETRFNDNTINKRRRQCLAS